MAEPKFVLRRTTPEQRVLGGQFELVLESAPDRPFMVASFGVHAEGFEFVSYEPLPGAEHVRTEASPFGLARMTYRVQHHDVRFEGFDAP